MKPLPQRRVVSVHEDTLTMTEGDRVYTLASVSVLMLNFDVPVFTVSSQFACVP